MSKYLRIFIILGIALLAAQAIADPPHPPQFLGEGHDNLFINYCDIATYTFKATIIDRPPGSDQPIRYHLISGPGVLDSKTGEWSWQPSLDGFSDRYAYIEVAASIGNNPNTMSEWRDQFSLRIRVANNPPTFMLGEYPSYSVISMTEVGKHYLDLNFTDPDTCEIVEIPEIVITGLDPKPIGSMKIIDDQLVFDLAQDDIGHKFYFVLRYAEDRNRLLGVYLIETRSDISLEFVDCPDTLKINVCDELIHKVKATDFAVDTAYYHDKIRHNILSGPGYITKQGEYHYQSSLDDTGKTFDVSVEAIYKTDLETYTAICDFSFSVEAYPTALTLKDHQCGDTIVFESQLSHWGIFLAGTNENSCVNQSIRVVSIEPEPYNGYILDSSIATRDYYWFYYPDEYDGDKTFKITFGMATEGDSLYCDLYLKNDWTPPEEKAYEIKIDFPNEVLQGKYVDIPVYLEKGSHPIGGYDFLIEYDQRILQFQYASQGEAFDLTNGCGWEYFTYRFGSAIPDSIYRSIRVVSIAETNNGDVHPSCYLPATFPSELFSMNFLVTNDRTFECDKGYIRFRWGDCGDNTIVDPSGQEIYVAEKVFDATDLDIYSNNRTLVDITDPTTGYPTRTGFQPQECPDNFVGQASITFVNGGVEIICAQPIDPTGDINLNGVSYEIADWVIFSNYFPYGDTIFHNYEAQSKASDANYDGNYLTVADWQYFFMVMFNRNLPLDSVMSDTLEANFILLENNSIIVATADYAYGATFIILSGNNNPELLRDDMLMDVFYDEGKNQTRVFISPPTTVSFYDRGNLLGNITGEVLSLDVTDIDGRIINSSLQMVLGVEENFNLLPDKFALAQNYPNPFNNATVISFSLPTSSIVDFEVFNVLGKRVYTVTEKYEAGFHKIYWAGDNVASGIYYYRITAGEFVDSKKMILLK